MAKSKVQLQIVTPERQVVDQPADSVVIPAHDGEIGILPGRAPLICELGIGALRYSSGGRTQRVFIDGGFAQVFENRVSVLTPEAVTESEATPQVIAQAEQTANAASTPPARRTGARRRASVLRQISVPHREHFV